MKKITTVLIIILSSLLFGCKKYLESEPFSAKSAEDFYKTASDAELALASCYNVLNAQVVQNSKLGASGGLFFMQIPIMLSGSTDEIVTRYNFSDADNAPWGVASWNSTTVYGGEVWFFLYAGIGRCNALLDNIDKITMDETRRGQVKGEARFLRGLYEMYLGMMYGAVPVNTSSTLNTTGARETVHVVFDQVVADLSYAYTSLPARATIAGRANKWSAAGFLAKTYAFLGSCKLNNVGADLSFAMNSFDWVDAAASYTRVKSLTDSIISLSAYNLTATYSNLFRETTKKYQDEECLFMAEGSEDPANGNYINMQNLFIPQGANAIVGGGLVRLVPVGELYQKYNANDLRRGWNLTGGLNGSTVKENIDGAIYYAPAAITAASIKTSATYYPAKYRMIDPTTKKITLNFWSGNYPILRLAEIYLLRAEAIYSTGGGLTAARADLSTVRLRSVGTVNIAAVNTSYLKTDFVQELLDERSRELCFEAMRHLDLMRFGRYTSTINALTSDKSLAFNNQSAVLLKANWAPYRIWFPIPYNELILNKNLVQNPGY